MFRETVEKIGNYAVTKENYLNEHKGGYFVASMMAGFFVGLGIFLIMTVGGITQESGMHRILMGVSFGIALSLVTVTGAELFTGNNMVMTIGGLNKSVSLKAVLRVWLWCYVGNLAGSMLVGYLFAVSGIGSTANFVDYMALSKSSYPIPVLFAKAILCNILVCLSTLCAMRLKEETAKLIMIFWCLYAFITSGYEHSVANMSLFTAAYFNPNATVTLEAMICNLAVVTLGNMLGGVLLGSAYYYMGKK